MRIGIDASNLRQGGGITHLVQLLAAAAPGSSGVDRVVVWGADDVLDTLADRPWLERHRPEGLASGIGRVGWQHRRLAAAAAGSVDVLFLPGGTYLGRFRPFVTMFRNMLPFDLAERRRYGASRMRLKMEILRAVQRATFRRADGVIFLNEFAQQVIAEDLGGIAGRTTVIPHGLDPRFFAAPRPQAPIVDYSKERPFRWLYVSAIHDYKRPWNVAEAVGQLREAGAPVTLEFIGPPYRSSLHRLNATLNRVDPARRFITMTPGVSHADLVRHYLGGDAFVFASTCENMPNSLLEAMAAGLPIACSERAPMTGILQDAGVYFDPESPASIAVTMEHLMRDHDLRAALSARAHALAEPYSWSRCAEDTFDFLASVATS